MHPHVVGLDKIGEHKDKQTSGIVKQHSRINESQGPVASFELRFTVEGHLVKIPDRVNDQDQVDSALGNAVKRMNALNKGGIDNQERDDQAEKQVEISLVFSQETNQVIVEEGEKNEFTESEQVE